VAIFGKTDSSPAQPPVPERAAGALPAGAAVAVTVIGSKARFVGEVSGDEDIVIHGRLEGNINVNRKVTVAASGELKGDVHARWVVVGGRVHGQIRADERAELLASASVQGNVNAPKVVIAEGAQLQGNVAMSAAAASPTAPASTKAEEN
jgi:cytoskeletal protein CcmA (bactofilin family)